MSAAETSSILTMSERLSQTSEATKKVAAYEIVLTDIAERKRETDKLRSESSLLLIQLSLHATSACIARELEEEFKALFQKLQCIVDEDLDSWNWSWISHLRAVLNTKLECIEEARMFDSFCD